MINAPLAPIVRRYYSIIEFVIRNEGLTVLWKTSISGTYLLTREELPYQLPADKFKFASEFAAVTRSCAGTEFILIKKGNQKQMALKEQL